MLVAKNVSYSIGRKDILKNISLAAIPGEILVIAGANGAGKSSLLRILSGETLASSGDITFNKIPLSRYKSNQLAKERAVLSQSTTLNLPFKVSEVVMMGRYMHFNNNPTQQDLNIVNQVMDEVKVVHLKDRIYTTLSGGEQQRVQLARVLAQIWEDESISADHPKYLLLDEPVSSLDLLHQHNTLQIAAMLKKKGYGIIAVLHDLNLTSQYADKILMLKDGVSIAYGNPENILTEENVFKSFGILVKVINHLHFDFPFIVPAISYKERPKDEELSIHFNSHLF